MKSNFFATTPGVILVGAGVIGSVCSIIGVRNATARQTPALTFSPRKNSKSDTAQIQIFSEVYW